VVVEPTKVSAGLHQLHFVIKWRKACDRDTHDDNGSIPMEFPEGGTSTITFHISEDKSAPTNDRVRVVVVRSVTTPPLADAPPTSSTPFSSFPNRAAQP
jgi:hypothetical protein